MDKLLGLFPEPRAVLCLVLQPGKQRREREVHRGEREAEKETKIEMEREAKKEAQTGWRERQRESWQRGRERDFEATLDPFSGQTEGEHVGCSKAVCTLVANQCQVLEILQCSWFQEWTAS